MEIGNILKMDFKIRNERKVFKMGMKTGFLLKKFEEYVGQDEDRPTNISMIVRTNDGIYFKTDDSIEYGEKGMKIMDYANFKVDENGDVRGVVQPYTILDCLAENKIKEDKIR